MKLKAPAFEIPSDDPFKNDLLSRKQSAEALTQLIRSADEPLVLCINAAWGEGKSTFLAMWRQMLNNENFKTLYFSAWENDFSDDAVVSLIGELELGIEALSLDKQQASAAKAGLKKAKKFGAALIRRGIPTAVKMATAGVVDLDEISEKALADYGEKVAEEQIKQYEASKKSVAGFKEQLSEFAKVTASKDEEALRPLVIIIDELDRCRPTYAIKILEAVKHFFSVPNVAFVLAVDREQLGHSIRSMYGVGMDVSGYLRRFIDIDYHLPLPDKGAFCRAQFARFGLIDLFKSRNIRGNEYDRTNFEEIFSELFAALGFSLREQERCFTLLSLALRITPNDYRLFPHLLSPLIILKTKNPVLYREFVCGHKDHHDVLRYISSTPLGRNFLYSHLGAVVEAFLVGCRFGRHALDVDVLEPYKKIWEDTSASAAERERAERILKFLGSHEFNDAFGTLNYALSKIDLVTNFRQ